MAGDGADATPSARTYPKAGAIIKTYIQQAEARRTASRFSTARARPRHTGAADGDGSGASPASSARVTVVDDGDEGLGAPAGVDRVSERPWTGSVVESGSEMNDLAAVAGLFAGKHKYLTRGATGPGDALLGSTLRRQLQADLATLALSPRPPSVAIGGSGGRTRHNLAAKLDAIARTSPWMRRRVVLHGDKTARGVFQSVMTVPPRHISGHSSNGPGGRAAGGNNSNGRVTGGGDAGTRGHDAVSEAEKERRVMAAFIRFVRRWRERKKQSEQAAISILHGQGGTGPQGPSAGTASRFAPKLQRELDAQSSNVVSILSRRMIREVPALKFFDDASEGDTSSSADTPAVKMRGVVAAPAATKANAMTPLEAVAARARARYRVAEPPRGVCYTLDESGCRRVKMQSGVVRHAAVSSSASKSAAAPSLPSQDKLEGISMEAAMGKSLRRKMARRVKSKRQAILKIGNNFEQSQREMALKLSARLALHQAESDKMFSKKMTVLCSDAAAAPPYLAQRELALARARVRKAALIEKCRTLHALGAALRRIENTGEMTGQDISTGELQFLEILRCIVETDQVLTPLLAEGVKREFSNEQLEMPLVSDLFRIFDQHVAGGNVTIEEAWSNPAAAPPPG